ncbi:MAG: chromosome segregation protein SMC [Rothia sp. (in: high G+C Gram-positive bacteria)]|uniref:chromosome segregation protein SMC n=1 Tax=Rothia sp. (in: high G+C Gram-positive bacteria) TaxID=1885016 RepID=UPI0026E05BDC|nr:chromosome segregation protein SMC [Rothia sp. (in: high G+C Gram-positive bacteria)]MDO5750948.1 chromosome segregation protein SMC [Rothia sp. (in: high G+C Gram-positive bacteria)]
MHLASLTLRGFKSFASATTFEFSSGMNAVVGPNGSGKSNILDALAWVMGSQTPKDLRGANMQDVIFSGSGAQDGKAQLGRAKVTLTFDNSDGTLSVPTPLVSISRTMFRAGGSEYDINGQSARLSDIHDLLAEAGLGTDLHVLVGQGRLDSVLHASSSQRRDIIEQAAGIEKYRRRQSKTERKLADLGANLTRLNDVAAELSHQLEPLGEQAEAASRARELQARIRQVRSMIAVREAQEINERLEDNARARAREEELLNERTAAATQHAEEVAQRATQREELSQRAQSMLGAFSQIQQALTRVRSAATIARHQQAGGAEDIVPFEQELESVTARMREEEHQLDLATVRLEASQRAREVIEANLVQTQQLLDESRLMAENLEQDVQRARDERLENTEQVALSRAALERASEALTEAQKELESRTSSAQQLESEHVQALAAVETAQAHEQSHTQAVAVARVNREEADKARDAAREESARASQAAAVVAERVQALSLMVSESLGDSEDKDSVLRIARVIEPAQGWDRALSQLLGSSVRAKISSEYKPSLNGASSVSEPVESTLYSSPLSLSSQGSDYDKNLNVALRQNLKPGSLMAADALSISETQELSESERNVLETALAELCSAVVFISAGDSAAAYSALEAGARCAIDSRGFAYFRSLVLAPESGNNTLVVAQQLREARALAQSADTKAQQSAASYQHRNTEYDQARERERALSRVLGESQAELAQARVALESVLVRMKSAGTEIERARERFEGAKSRLEIARVEYDQQLAELEKSEENLERALQALAADTHKSESSNSDADNDQNSSEFIPESLPERISRLNKQVEKYTAELAEARQTWVRAESARELILGTLQRTYEEHGRASFQLEQAKERRNSLAARAARAVSVQKCASALAEKLSEALAQAESERTRAQSELAAHREHQSADEQNTRAMAVAVEASQALLASLEMERTRTESSLESLQERTLTHTGDSLETLAAAYPVEEDEDRAEVRTALTARLNATQKDLEKLGVTNPLALQEYEALQERYSYLSRQIADVQSSREDLRTVMDEVTARMGEAFMQAFEDINGHYQRIIGVLFPGGEGSLSLSDPQDVLGSGVEISVRPAGKKVKRLSLLSGGERSLASLALLIAIFMARPSPFYALDEVEAALDDRNLGRLLQVLEELSESSQLLMITHQQRTMERADVLYGISMRDGVSAVISQDMQQLRELLD